MTHAIVVVVPENPRDVRGDELVRRGARDERAVHVDVVAAEVQGDETLEDDSTSWVGGSEEAEQAGRRAAICDHVQHGTKLGALTQCASGHAIGSIEKARDAIQQGACFWIRLHVVE